MYAACTTASPPIHIHYTVNYEHAFEKCLTWNEWLYSNFTSLQKLYKNHPTIRLQQLCRISSSWSHNVLFMLYLILVHLTSSNSILNMTSFIHLPNVVVVPLFTPPKNTRNRYFANNQVELSNNICCTFTYVLVTCYTPQTEVTSRS